MNLPIYEISEDITESLSEALCRTGLEVVKKCRFNAKLKVEEHYLSALRGDKEVLWVGVCKQPSEKFLIMIVRKKPFAESNPISSLLALHIERLGGYKQNIDE